MGQVMDGKAVARRVRSEIRGRVRQLKASGVVPGLSVVLVGDNPASQIYVRRKELACVEVGIASRVHRLPATTSQAELLALVAALNEDATVDGVLVQLPLPRPLNARTTINAIHPAKDVDAFHPVNMGQVTTGRPTLVPCTAKGVMRLLAEYEVPLRGRHAVVVGRSRVVGRPMAALLLAADATVSICHRHTPDSAALTSMADVLVVAVGIADLVRASWVKEGAVVVDVGISRREDRTLAGDVAFDEVLPKASLLTPVPGGVGPMTIAMLLDNTCVIAERRAALDHA